MAHRGKRRYISISLLTREISTSVLERQIRFIRNKPCLTSLGNFCSVFSVGIRDVHTRISTSFSLVYVRAVLPSRFWFDLYSMSGVFMYLRSIFCAMISQRQSTFTWVSVYLECYYIICACISGVKSVVCIYMHRKFPSMSMPCCVISEGFSLPGRWCHQ